ncbi:carboxylesterase/lipase family protein [Streptomyces sp. A3M-1-3]|uniref:carboxylesterase/lipase family protein n=1 Tax=Streptomyces sp. A3M-1-3 TaxID=2962044 RepID=UPI0020B7CDE1|nr:carboxylesterase/lipase family protein [Streptomyces sp. A3M-1-3]MCP3818470.1 carboxylesterase/lipase family protein [Streptomyces sp. A3M-1-3]
MIIRTAYGPVEGTSTTRGTAFKGIPFAAPPIGSLRFQPPQPPQPWAEVRPATAYGPAAPQPHDLVLEEMFGQPPFPTDEASCLTLNIWTPSPNSRGTACPVMVWLHGGAFLTGSGRDPVFDGSRLAHRHDVIVITLNYRLGALGFLHLGELLGERYAQSGNLGLLDQAAALAWIRDNIEAFGGDPGNVTVFGQSAGAMSVVSLLAMPAAAGLFHKAIVQSGSAEYVHEPAHATAVTRELLAALDIAEDAAHTLHDVPVGRLLQAQQAVGEAMRARGEGLGLPFAPVIDGVTLPEAPLDAIRNGSAAGIPVILGTNLEEGRLFLIGPDAPAIDEASLTALFGAAYDEPDKALDAFRALEPDPSPLGLLAALTGEQMFRAPTARLAETQALVSPDLWLYLFTWRSKAGNGELGACHSLELPFVFDNLDQPGIRKFTGDEPPTSLAHSMSTAWATFARFGDPGADWAPFDTDSHRTMIFDTASMTADDPLGAIRGL